MPALTDAPAALGGRDEPHVITQTISKLSTTFTTVVTLGGGPTNYPGDKVDSDADIYGGSGDGSGLTNVQIGAIVGSSIAFILILLITWYCILQQRARLEAGDDRTDSLYDSSRSSSRSRGSPPPPRPPPPVRVRENIPGGPKYPTYRALPIRNPRNNPQVRRSS